MEKTLTLPLPRYNGNGQAYQLPMPKVVILTEYINDVALKHLEANTGLCFTKDHWLGYVCEPNTAGQLLNLFLTYNFKSRYYNNATFQNELHLKFCDTGFDVEHICFDCCEKNHIYTGDMKQTDISR